MFRSIIRLSTNTTTTTTNTTNTNTSSTIHQSSFYERPIRRIISECCQGNCFFHFLTIKITSAAYFHIVFILLDASIGDLEWVLSVYDVNSPNSNGIVLSLPPIACNDPILSWVWSFIDVLHMASLSHRVEAANELASLTIDNDRNKKIIVEVGGIPPLLRLLKQGFFSPESQAASNALSNLATDRQRIRMIVSEHGAPIVCSISVANLVSRMAKNDPAAQEEFARDNLIRPLVSLLSFDTFLDEPKSQPHKATRFHSLVKINKDLQGGGGGKSSRENENSDVKLKLKINCVEALWMLSKESISNSRRITETIGLLYLQMNCLITVMEITAAAEVNADLRRAAFKTNSPASKAVMEQLLTLVQQETKTRVIKPVVLQRGNKNLDVATEAAITLGKFACPENFLCVEHSKTIIEPGNDLAQMHGLILLCYLTLNVDSSEGLERARSALEGAARSSILMQNYPSLREMILKAISHLVVYETGV
ncbi:hypothetical protein MKX01_011672 [Papaver californicum]|nr:hypothetical protein MKX01_011672 [Papaver californicum]